MQSQRMKSKFRFPRFLHKKSAKANKRASLAGACPPPREKLLTNDNTFNNNHSSGKPGKKHLKLKHTKSLDCLDFDSPSLDCDLVKSGGGFDGDSRKCQSMDRADFDLDDVVKIKKRCLVNDVNGNSFKLDNEETEMSFHDDITPDNNQNDVQPDTKSDFLGETNCMTVDDPAGFNFDDLYAHRNTRSRLMRMQSDATIPELDESDSESIFSADIAWERENAEIEPADLTTDSQGQDFK